MGSAGPAGGQRRAGRRRAALSPARQATPPEGGITLARSCPPCPHYFWGNPPRRGKARTPGGSGCGSRGRGARPGWEPVSPYLPPARAILSAGREQPDSAAGARGRARSAGGSGLALAPRNTGERGRTFPSSAGFQPKSCSARSRRASEGGRGGGGLARACIAPPDSDCTKPKASLLLSSTKRRYEEGAASLKRS